MRKTFQYRLYPTKGQITLLRRTLAACRWLYNHLLEERTTAWQEHGQHLGRYTFKAECAGRKVVLVNPAYTSQTCSGCGQRQEMPLTERIYRCPYCQLVLDRDHNAALTIKALGLQRVGVSLKAPV